MISQNPQEGSPLVHLVVCYRIGFSASIHAINIDSLCAMSTVLGLQDRAVDIEIVARMCP